MNNQLTSVPDHVYSRSLDEWYIRLNKIYLDRNFYRSPDSLLLHLVEIVGGLSLLASEKVKPGVLPEEYIAKGLAWWFALCGKLRIRSVEELVWSKFPYACPYCRSRPHNDPKCRQFKAKSKSPDWTLLADVRIKNETLRPTNLGGWLHMFTDLYPAAQGESFEKVFARFSEELGELSEATRLFNLAPGYFFSEASDLFAWMMHLFVILCTKREVYEGDAERWLTELLYRQYPDRCKDCGGALCQCPPVLRKTFGRIASEMRLDKLMPPPLLSLEQAMEAFELSSGRIKLGEQSFEVTEALLRDLYEVAGVLSDGIAHIKSEQDANTVTLLNALRDVQRLAEAERVTQEAIDSLTQAIADLPPSARDRSEQLLLGTGGSLLATAIVEYVKLKTGMI